MKIGRFAASYKGYLITTFSALQIGCSRTDYGRGLHIWLQFGRKMHTGFVEILPKPTRQTPQPPQAQPEPRSIDANPHAFWGGFGGAGEA